MKSKKKCALPKRWVSKLFPKSRSAADALRLAYGLIRSEKHWVTNHLAVNHLDSSIEIDPRAPEARAFCALGALLHVNGKYQVQAERFLTKAAEQIAEGETGREAIFNVNDDIGHKEVCKMFRMAIKQAEE